MRDPLAPFLETQGFAVLDGGLATELERRGADLDDPLWSAKMLLDAPEAIESLHYDYFRAGADIGISASYQASFEGFARRGLDRGEAARLLRLSVELVARARDRFWSEARNRDGRLPPLIAASIGCYGAVLHDGSEYRGDYRISQAELSSFHEARLEVLARAGADLLACETVPCAHEADVLTELLDVPSWLSFSCRDGARLASGEVFAPVAEKAAAKEAVLAVGVNCTPPEYIESLLRSVTRTDKPLVCYPNSGETWDAPSGSWLPPSEEAEAASRAPGLAASASNWHGAGARLLGGCCRCGPEAIRDLRRRLEALSQGARL